MIAKRTLTAFAWLACALSIGIGEGEPSLATYYAAGDTLNGRVYVYLTNTSAAPQRVTEITACRADEGGEPAGLALYWSRARPNPIPPQGLALVSLCLREAPPAKLQVLLKVEGQPAPPILVAVQPPRLRIAYLSCGGALRRVRVYLRSGEDRADRVKRVVLDGTDVGGDATLWGEGRLFRGWTALDLQLATPLEVGSYHVVDVATEGGERAVAQFRAMRAAFPVGAYGALGEATFADLVAHNVGHYASFGPLSSADLQRLAAHRLTAGGSPFGAQENQAGGPAEAARERGTIGSLLGQYRRAGNLLYVSLMEEPDYRDYFRGGLGSLAAEVLRRADLCAQYAPELPTFVQIDNTYRYDNYRVYGALPDICASNRYALGQGDVAAEVREGCAALRVAAQPGPWYFITQFFRLGIEGDDRRGRMPTAAEMQLQCYAALAEGAKGIVHYCHSGDVHGGEGALDKPLWDGMSRLHRVLCQLGDVLSDGDLTDWAESDSSAVAAAAIARPPTDVVLVLLNRAARSSLEGLSVLPAEEVHVTVHLPPWLQPVALAEADTGRALPYEATPGTVRVAVGRVEIGGLYLLKTRAAP